MKLFSRKTQNLIQLLEWLKQILHYRTQFLKGHVTEASMSTSCKILQRMYIMLETVLLLFLRNINIDAVRVAMSCFKYLVLEAELVDASLVPYAPNLLLYRQLESLSTAPQIGRASQQKKLRAILKGLVHTPGSALAWEDTYSSWRVTKANLISYQRGGRDESSSSTLEFGRFGTDSFPRHFMRRTTQTISNSTISKEGQLSEDKLQAEMLNWTNMTGFLCSLAGVSTKASPSNYSLWLMNDGANGDACFIDGPPGDVGVLLPPDPVLPPSPVRDPNHIRVKRSSSYHSRPKSMTHMNPPSSRGGSSEDVEPVTPSPLSIKPILSLPRS
jgi:neurofibromin 1